MSMIDKLIELARQNRGCLTFKELNDVLPPEMVTTVEIDRVLPRS
jgi:hypothetical protein